MNDIMRIHKDMADTPVMANHAVKRLSTAIKWFNKQSLTNYANPCSNIQLYKEKPRLRFLEAPEAAKLVQELERMRFIYRFHEQADALLMMLYTGQRKSNVLAMRTDEIRDNIWVIPGDKAKAGRDIVVPLNSFAQAILKARQPEITDGWVFPSKGRNGQIQRLKSCRHTFWVACRNVGIVNCHIHDLRRTLGSWMLISGASIAEVSRTLGHSSIKVTEKVYAHLLPGEISSATETALNVMLNKKE